MDLLRDLNNRVKLMENEFDDEFDPDDITALPEFILKQLARDAKRHMRAGRATTPLDAALQAVQVADLAGLESDDDMLKAAEKVVPYMGK